MGRQFVTCLAVLLTLSALPPITAHAEVTHQADNGFTVKHQVTVEKEAFVIYRTLTAHIDQWWSADHTWSGDASNLSTDMELGGCFCEKLPNGGEVEHLRLIFFSPGNEIRWKGALGPLQSMPVDGLMIWQIQPNEGKQVVTFTYHVWGNPPGGLAGIAPAVDGVIGEQLASLEKRLGWE